jgi:hypothetical protein
MFLLILFSPESFESEQKIQYAKILPQRSTVIAKNEGVSRFKNKK